MTKRIQWLDIVKGVAILGVVLQHTCQRLMTYYHLSDDMTLNFINGLIANCNMKLFFAVSGFIFFLSRQRYQAQPKQFVKTRFIDLIIPYLILGPTIWLGKFALSSFVKNQVSISTLYDMFITPIAFMWFIYVLFIIEVLALLIDRFAKGNYWVPLIVLYAVSLSTKYYDFGNSADIFHLVPLYLFWYYIGGVLALYKEKVCWLGKPMVTLVLGVLWIGSHTLGALVDFALLGIIGSLSGVAFWFSLYRDKELVSAANKFFHYLGKRTMYIYILNPLILNGTWQVLKNLVRGGAVIMDNCAMLRCLCPSDSLCYRQYCT